MVADQRQTADSETITPVRLNFLDGVRGWGAVIVLLYHVCCDGLPADPALGIGLQRLPIFNGVLAVLVFFVVSGFSLSVRYLADGQTDPLMRIAAGRYFRLAIPIFAACLIVHLAMVLGFIDPSSQRMPTFRDFLNFDPTTAHLLKFSLFGVFFDYRPAETYIGPLWTMSIELLGSFGVLGLIFLVRQFRYRIPALLLAAGLVAFFAPTDNTAMLALFPIGAVLADAFNRGRLERIPVPAGAALLLIGSAVPAFVSFSDFTWGLGATLIVIGCIAVPQIKSFLSGRVSGWLGKISFPLYLIHGPMIWIIGEPLMRRYGVSVEIRLVIDLATIAVSFAAAWLFLPVNTFSIWMARNFGHRFVHLVRRTAAE